MTRDEVRLAVRFFFGGLIANVAVLGTIKWIVGVQ